MTTTANETFTASPDEETHRSSQPRLHQHGVEVQAFGTVRRLPIALAHEARLESCQQLNRILADSFILHSLYKKHHWLMRGHTFSQLHRQLDEHATEQLEIIDLLAERVQTLGGVAVGDPRHAAEITTIPRSPNGVEAVPAMLSRLLEGHEIICAKVRPAITRTAARGDDGTVDLLVGGVLRRHEFQVWVLSEHLVDTPAARL